ncbi:MAG: translation elongation factor Ts [Acidobacteria bacterium]|nr:translation elongation factor Ts [Acidobacteriota bacterium]
MQITPAMVKELREKTDAGMMECKTALVEADGDMEKAVEILRKRGVATASKKSTRVASEGVIGSYIHHNHKVGVLIEVNCETDFVAKNDKFKELVHNVAMQIAVTRPRWVRRDEVPAAVVEKEREIYREALKNDEKNRNKPPAVMDKIIDGRIEKFFKETCLTEQEYIKDSTMTIEGYVHSIIGVIKENIRIRRFCCFKVGEE